MQELKDLVAESVREIKSVRDGLDEVKAGQKAIRHSLDGNGTPGIKTRLALIEQHHATNSDVERRVDALEQWRYQVLGIAIGVSTVVSMVGAAIGFLLGKH